ncbi:MAG: TIR domain-containing protein, partial [Alphaproteobacteria bacterium]
MTDRLRPYEGTGPFTFVSYAHKDKGAAEQIIAALTQNGVNTWYDLGIAPGTIWRNELAEKIQGCQTFLFLQSAQSLQSENCQSEISYALEQKKKVVVVRLDRTELPGGMALAIGERQAIEKFDLPEQDFYEILLKALAPGEKTPIVRQPGKTVSLFGYHLQRTPAYVGLGTLAAILVGATAYFVMPSTTQPSNQETPAVHAPTHGTEANWSALAVLPFANLSGDPEKDILSDGISVELMKVIGENTDLKIAARTSSFVFKDSALDAREIGEALGVDGLLEGSVRWFGDRIDVDVQLIDANTGFQVWSDSYQRDSVDYFKVQQEIAYAVASRVNSRISARTQASQAANTLSLQSWEKYLAALDLMQNDTRETYLRASEIFADIIETNPDFSAAYSSKANALLLAQGHRAADEIQRLVDKALALDPANAEAMAAQVGLYNSQSKYSEAEAALTKAEALMSNSVTLNFAAVYTYAPQGDYKTALIHARKAYEMDPFSPIA